MTRNSLSITAIALVICAGCSKEYGHERLGADGPEARQVRSLVAALRQAGPDGLDRVLAGQAMPGLTEQQLTGLRSALDQIITADKTELRKIEKFGKQAYRAVFDLQTAEGPKSLAMLLAVGEDDTLKWLGKN